METKYIIGFVGAIVLILGGLIFINARSHETPSGLNLDGFAQCLVDKKVTFFGAFWCPHCQATKKMFGTSQKLLPYVECSTADGKAQTQVCIDNKVAQYPTWEFADKTRLTGERTLEELSVKSGCPLPGASTTATTTAPITGSSSAAVQ